MRVEMADGAGRFVDITGDVGDITVSGDYQLEHDDFIRTGPPIELTFNAEYVEPVRIVMYDGMVQYDGEATIVERTPTGLKVKPRATFVKTEWEGPPRAIHGGAHNARGAEGRGLLTHEQAQAIVDWARLERRRRKAAARRRG